MEGKQFHSRVWVVILVLALLLGLFVAVLYNLQVVNGATYLAQSTLKIANRETVEAARGEILDRYGRVLVSNRATYQVTLDTTIMGAEPERNANLLKLLAISRAQGVVWVDTLPISQDAPFTYTGEDALYTATVQEDGTTRTNPNRLRRLLTALNLKSLGDKPTAQQVMVRLREYFLVDPALSDGEARALIGLLYELNLRKKDVVMTGYVFAQDVDIAFISTVKEQNLVGVRIEATTVREYSTPYAAHLLGRVGPIFSDEWQSYKDLGYSMDDTVGKDGAELAFESYLRGQAGERSLELSTTGKVVSESWVTDFTTGEVLEPKPGGNTFLTIDLKLQEVVERSLAEAIPKLPSTQTQGGAMVVVDVKNGGVLASASYPTVDLSTIYSDTAAYNAAVEDPLKPLYNRATLGTYAPGSTYKMVVATGGLQEGIITNRTKILCTGRYTYYSRVQDQPMCWILRQYGGTHGPQNLTDAIKNSCNIFFYDTGRQLGIERLETYARMYGLGEPTGIELPESVGVVASQTYTESLGQKWYEGNTLYAAIGQENNRFTPLQLANYIATLVNGGNHYAAHLLQSVKSNDFSQVLYQQEPELMDTIPIGQENLDAIKEGMRLTATEGTIAKYFKDLDVTLGAKTGTAQISANSEANAVFVCFAPFEDPQIAISIVVEKGGSGGELAAVAAQVLDYYFNAERTLESVSTENTLLR